jgi:hypothetical protein
MASPSCIAFPATAPPFPGAREQAERIEAEVFRTSYGETAEALRSYYAHYDDQMYFVLARDGDWAGMLRLGVPGSLASLSAEDAAAPPFDVDLTAVLAADHGGPVTLLDVLTAAVQAGRSHSGIFERMLVAAVDVADGHTCTHIIAMIDSLVIAYFASRGVTFTVHTAAHPYYGSPGSAAVSIPVAVLRAWLAAHVPQ